MITQEQSYYIFGGLGVLYFFWPQLKQLLSGIKLPTLTSTVVPPVEKVRVDNLDKCTVHEIVEFLIKQEDDEEATMLLVAYGKKLYDKCLKKGVPK